MGGTIDNPDVIDKEAGTLALEAYLARDPHHLSVAAILLHNTKGCWRCQAEHTIWPAPRRFSNGSPRRVQRSDR